jgi:predicted SAM-dependent methyltransferase
VSLSELVHRVTAPQIDAQGRRRPVDIAKLTARRLRREARSLSANVRPPSGVDEYLAGDAPHKLHVGAGTVLLPGWLNTDRDPNPEGGVYLDATRRFPLPDSSFHYVYSEHTIEHFTYAQGQSMLAECHRVLRPGGRIRLATPDLEKMVSLVVRAEEDAQRHYIRWATDTFLDASRGYRSSHVINNAFRGWGHKFIYDDATLRAALLEAGFVDARRFGFGESDDPVLRGIESHGDHTVDSDMVRFETLIVEAVRP